MSQLPEIKAKKEATCKAKFGASTNLVLDENKKKVKETNLAKYGHECSLHGGTGLQRKMETWNGSHPLTRPEVIAATRATREARGLNKVINGRPMRAVAEEVGLAYSTFQQAVKTHGIDYAMALTPKESTLETIVSDWLNAAGVSYCKNVQLAGTKYRPDFYIPEHRLVIECDGVYWHSDAVLVDKEYHARKKAVYADLGYKSLFFRSDELEKNSHICKSMIFHKLGKSQRVGANKCKISPGTAEFIQQNHLMGARPLDKVISLFFGDVEVAALAYRWKNKQEQRLEISRFCIAAGFSVAGGYMRLLSYVRKLLNPRSIFTFVDLRYGNPEYMSTLGFVLKSQFTSFKWTKNKETLHRLRFPGNTGYDAGYSKIWDCGQAAYELTCE